MIAIALDDEPLALQVLQALCDANNAITSLTTFTKPQEAAAYIESKPVDLLFLDIEMPSISGIEFYNALSKKPKVIFTTAYQEYALEGFNLNAIDYLLKPFTKTRFDQAINKAKLLMEIKDESKIVIKEGLTKLNIAVKDIIWVESLGNYLKIRLSNQKEVLTRMTFKEFFDTLPNGHLVRIHKSFAVSISKIEAVKTAEIVVAGKSFPIGNAFKNDLENYL